MGKIGSDKQGHALVCLRCKQTAELDRKKRGGFGSNMKKRWRVLLIALVSLFSFAFAFTACGGSSGGSIGIRGTYYAYEGDGELDKEDYVTLSSGGKCEISMFSDFGDGLKCTYRVSGSKLTVTIEMMGEKEVLEGTVGGGKLTLDIEGYEAVYYQEGKQPSEGDPEPPPGDGYVVTLNANGGAFASGATASVRVQENELLKIETEPTRAGYKLDGWAKDKSGTQLWDLSKDKVTDDVTLYAVWVRVYTVTLNANGGTFGDGKDTYQTLLPYDSLLNVSQTPTRADYLFDGWYTQKSATEESAWDLENDTVVKNVTLYAGWKPLITDYEITYVLNYDGAENVVMQTENGKATYVPERTGYIFNGWWTGADPAYSRKFDTSALVTGDRTLYADWIAEADAVRVLDAPENVVVKDGMITWSAVSGATTYRVFVRYTSIGDYEMDDYEDKSVSGTSISFPFSTAGNYSVSVRANGDGVKTLNSAPRTVSYSHRVLASTTISFDIANSVLTWTEVPNAAYYRVFIDNEEVIESTRYTYYYMGAYEAGSHSVRIDAENSGYITSTVRGSIVKRRLSVPQVVISVDAMSRGYLLSWEECVHADRYEITVGERTEWVIKETDNALWKPSFTIGQNSQLWNGEQSLQFAVKAYDSNGDYLVSAATGEETLGKLYLLDVSTSIPESTSVDIYGTYYGSVGGSSVTVSFNLNGASGSIGSQTIDDTQGLFYPVIPTRSGYIFAGWYSTASCNGDPFDFSQAVSRNTVLYAKWVTHSGNGVIAYNGNSGRISCVGRNDSGQKYYAFVPLVSGEITVYSANNSGDTYGYLCDSTKSQLDSDDDDGGNQNFKMTYNVTAGELYYVRPCGYNSTQTMTVYVQGAEPAEGGLSSSGVTLVPYGEEITLETSRNYNSTAVFDGWYKIAANGMQTKVTPDEDSDYRISYTVTNENETYLARWINRPVTIESGNSSMGSVEFYNSASIVGGETKIRAISRSGYMFVGWFDKENLNGEAVCTDFIYTFDMPNDDGEVTYVAKFMECPVIIEVSDSSAGSVSGISGASKVGDEASVTAYTNDGYTFFGWYNKDTSTLLTKELELTFIMPADSVKITYVAVWAECPVTLRTAVEKNGVTDGSLVGGTVSGLEGATRVDTDVTVTAVSNDGFTFLGWFDKDGAKLSDELTYMFRITTDMSGNSTEYIAKWTYYTVTAVSDNDNGGYAGYATVTFDLNYSGANNSVPSQKITRDTPIRRTSMPTRSNYVFTGWYTDEACENRFDLSTNVSKDITLYAGWYSMRDSNRVYDSSAVIDTTNNYNTSGSARSVSTNSRVCTFFTAWKTGTIRIYYKNGSGSSSYRTSFYIYNLSKSTNSSIQGGTLSYTSYSYVDTQVTAGDVLCFWSYRYSSSSYTTTVSFYVTDNAETDGGVFADTCKATVGETHTLRAEAKEGYTFVGWFKNDETTAVSTDLVYQYTMTAEDVTFTAKWVLTEGEVDVPEVPAA